jgi:hypothetical protein
MKYLIIIVLALFTINISAQTGYLVTISYAGKTSVHRTTDFNHVNKMIKSRYSFTVKEEVVFSEKNNSFEIFINNTLFYCEKRRVVVKKNGRVKFKKLK